MTAAAAKAAKHAKPKKPARPVYLTVRKLVDPATGEEIGALVPSTHWDQRAMHDRRLKVGTQVRGRLEKPRNVKLHRLGHALCKFVAERVPGFEDEDGHKALKRLQRECGAFCDQVEIDASPVISAILAAAESLLGEAAARMLRSVLPEIKTVSMTVARSIAFDEMDDDEFADLLKQISRHISANYLTTMTPDEIEAAVEMMVQE